MGKCSQFFLEKTEIPLDKTGILGYNKEADFGGAEIL